MKLWIDDERPAPAGWHHARTYATAEIAMLAAIEGGTPPAQSEARRNFSFDRKHSRARIWV